MKLRSLLIGLTVAAAGVVSAPAATASDTPTPFIVGGRPATENYTFMVYTGGCTGSLIKANWALTAKHCSTPSSVRVGSNDRTKGGTVVKVTRGVSHPTEDVKLLQLADSVTHQPIAIPVQSGPPGTATRLLGWGVTCPTRGCGSAPVANHEFDTSILADSKCRGIRSATEICTNNPNKGGDCYGDSGGPQITKVNGVWRQIGSDSRGTTSACGAGPSIYVDLTSVRTWISQQVGTLP
ncbi:serine protease [Lentzea sp. NBRC 105346]|uniref:S1 family peptidase n=1 Tax=Lentzea sp. NBRC 105346 TaxID=3032205 RepID=UPI0024A4CCF5|nr:trypsin-like serine protease [Lentzea sp. NBRC 105346]GLZ28448.1 serine protease [Lentzea sp. NBRC 105346]